MKLIRNMGVSTNNLDDLHMSAYPNIDKWIYANTKENFVVLRPVTSTRNTIIRNIRTRKNNES